MADLFHVERGWHLVKDQKATSGYVWAQDETGFSVCRGGQKGPGGHVHLASDKEGNAVDGVVVARVVEEEGQRVLNLCSPLPVDQVLAIAKVAKDAPKADPTPKPYVPGSPTGGR
jgi:hypothetical protein